MNKSRLTSYNDILKRTKTTIVQTRSGNTFEIKVLQPGDFLSIIGTPITKRIFFDPKGKFAVPNFNDDYEATNTIQDLMSDDEFMRNAKDMVCRGIVSLNFVNKPQDQCDPDAQELSIDLLDFNEIMDIVSFLIVASTADREVKEFYSFRDLDSQEQARGDQDSPVGEGIQSAAQ